MYSCLLNDQGGVIDDLIVYYMNDNWCRVIVNATTREKDIKWFSEHIGSFNLELKEREDLAMLAVQGPEAVNIVNKVLSIEETPKIFTASNSRYAAA